MNKLEKLGIYFKGSWLGWLLCRMLYQTEYLKWKSYVIYGAMILICLLLDFKYIFKKDGNKQ